MFVLALASVTVEIAAYLQIHPTRHRLPSPRNRRISGDTLIDRVHDCSSSTYCTALTGLHQTPFDSHSDDNINAERRKGILVLFTVPLGK